MEDALYSAIKKFFSKIRQEPKRVFHGRGQLFPEYSHVCMDWYPPVVFVSANSPFLDEQFLLDKFERHLPKAKFVESMAAAPEFLDRFPERALKIFRFEFSSE